MEKREVVKLAIEGRKVPYVPWHCGFTVEAAEKLQSHFGRQDLEPVLDNHFVKLGSDIGFFKALDNDRFQDVFGVVWDRSVDKDIGIVEELLLPEPHTIVYSVPNARLFLSLWVHEARCSQPFLVPRSDSLQCFASA